MINIEVEKYIKKGFVCHPLSKHDDKGKSPGKRPILTGWQIFTKTPDDIDKYIEEGYNIGLVCGSASGVDAIDIDIDLFKDELLNGFEPNTLISGHREGRGHLLFQHRDDIFSEKHHFIGIEYFGNNKDGAGSNLVLPPSIHHSGEVYKWKNPDAPLAKIPDQLKENWLALCKKEDALHEYFKKCRYCFTKGSKKYSKEDVRSKGIWERPDSITVHGMDGRQTVIAIMGELKNQGCPDELLHMACKRFFGKDYKANETAEALKYIKSIPPKCETLRKFLNVECDECTWQPLASNKPKEEVFSLWSSDEKKEHVFLIPTLTTDEINKLNEGERNRKLELSLPADHFISQYVKWLCSISDGYQEYSISGALWILSAIAKDKFILPLKQERVKPNLWIFDIGKSTTSRKSTIVNKTRKMMEFATDCILPNQDYSLEGYLESLSLKPITHNVRDEAAGLLSKYHLKYNDGIFDLECQLYDGQNVEKTLASKGKKEPQTYKIINPYITKLYATTPENLSRSLTIDDFLSGYGYRWIFVYPNYLRVRKPLEMEAPEDIEAWQNILTKIKSLDYTFEQLVGTVGFKVNDDAMRYYDAICQDLETKADESNNDILNSVIGRSEIHILKIAMLIELGKVHMSTTIDIYSIEVAARMVTEFFIPGVMDLISRMQEDIKNNKIEKLISILRRVGGTTHRTKLLRDSHFVAKDFNDCIETMLISNTIRVVKNAETKGEIFILQDHNEKIDISKTHRNHKTHIYTDGKNINANNAKTTSIDVKPGIDGTCVYANSANSANSAKVANGCVLNPVTANTSVTELTKMLEKARASWEQINGIINSQNATAFSLWFCEHFSPIWSGNGEQVKYTPSGIRGIVIKMFGLTPNSEATK